ncbi:MAG: glutamate racemase [Chloroflexi bacterium]|nr:MAG: glutamate racemase [Chloroflexota bacterium]
MTDLPPIGFFDSGIGGLSVWRAVARLLPHIPTVYVADSAYCPYGDRPPAEVVERSVAVSRFLLRHHCAPIVVACNTASAAALKTLRQMFDVPFVGMEPAVKPAAQASKTGHIGVLATAGTVQGELFQNTTRRYANGVQVHVQVGTGLVEQIEAGRLDHPDTLNLLNRYLLPMLTAGADQIVLGCTHYPLLAPVIRQMVGPQVTLVDPADAVARQVQRVRSSLFPQEQTGSPAAPENRYRFFTTGSNRQIAFLNQEWLPDGMAGINFLPAVIN